jgi:transposase
MEASFGWGWLSDLMEEVGLMPQLSNCYKVEQHRKAQGIAKTNKKDADLLSELPFDKKPWWHVWRAPPEVRQRRECMRYRADLVRLSTGTKNRIHAVFHRQGVFYEFSDLFGGQGRRFLRALAVNGRHAGGVLPEAARDALAGHLRVLMALRAELATVTWRLKGQLKRDPLVKRLDGIPGIGLILAHTLAAEIGDIERFATDGKLASYSCLAPQSKDTGEPDPRRAPLGRHLGDRGNLVLKWAFIEAAHGAVRHGGKWRAMWDRATRSGRKDRNRGYIKVARELVRIVHIVWSRNVEYTEAPPPRPGSEGRCGGRRQSRPGTGQPSGAMVQAMKA